MIDSYGCDYSTSGISPDNLQTKVKAFFDRRTGDGPKFDTYILYFSGDTYDTGDWALTGTILLLHPLPPSLRPHIRSLQIHSRVDTCTYEIPTVR